MIILDDVLRIKIADIVLEVKAAQTGINFVLGEEYREFISHGQPDVNLQWHCDYLPEFKPAEEVFDSGSFWHLQSTNGYFILSYPAPTSRSNLFKIVRLTEDFRQGDIYLHPDFLSASRKANPLTDRLDELLYMHLLGGGLGLLFHGCCVSYRGRGLLFLGHSRAGKSTLARLWKKHIPEARILTDESAVVRCVKGQYYAYGTPWHGTAESALPDSVPLTEVYIIEHAKTNSLQPLQGAQKVAEVTSRTFVPFWLHSATEYSLGFLDQMLQNVLCQRLCFRPKTDVFTLLNAGDR